MIKIKKTVKELKEDLKKSEEINQKRLNDLKYLQADFENLKKHFNKEKEQIINLANENFFKQMLPLLDDFEALKKVEKNEGVEMIYEKFLKLLDSNGLKEINETNVDFDSEKHEAVMSKKGVESKVLEVLSKGYVLKNKTIRPARVVVGKKIEV